MNQPDSLNVQNSVDANASQEMNVEQFEATKHGREWFPEDEDEWYEPDYSKSERPS